MEREDMLRRLENGEDPLELSIEKWQDIVDGKGEDEENSNCALCEKYQTNIPPIYYLQEACKGCPVFQKTKKRFCRDTLYHYYQYSKSTEDAIEELNFLKSLRKKVKEKKVK